MKIRDYERLLQMAEDLRDAIDVILNNTDGDFPMEQKVADEATELLKDLGRS
jgi:hypothetical protein